MIKIPWRWLFLILILFGAWKYWTKPSIEVAPNDPVQSYKDEGALWQQGNYELKVLANYDIEARVLSKRIYDSGDESDLAPVDLALGWGAMSNSSFLNKLTIGQANRHYYYRWEGMPPLPPNEMASHSANTHLIPANSEIETQIREVSVGQVVHIVGHLVEARSPLGRLWRSSLTREDTGDGACELIRVQSIDIR